MYVVLERPDRPPLRIKIDGNRAFVGRAAHCDVVIEEEFVSKQHLALLQGIIAVDQSTNGSFLDGVRLNGPTVIGTKPISIAQTDITVRVEGEPQAAIAGGDAELVALRGQVDTLLRQVDELQAAAAAAAGVAAPAPELGLLQQENTSLRGRIAELERKLQEAAAPVPQKPADDSPVSLLIFKLQRENAELKRALAQQAPAAPVPPPTAGVQPAAKPAAPKPNVLDAFPAFAKLQKPVTPETSVSVDKVPPPPPKGVPQPVPAAAAAPAAPDRTGIVFTRLSELVNLDADELPTRAGDNLDAFLIAEGFRFLRRVERVVSRVSSGFIQLYQAQTLVPGVEGTLRDFLRSALAAPDQPLVRERFLGYLRELGRWMVAALLAYRQAAEKFAAQVRSELSPEVLLPDQAGPGKKLSPKIEAELWRRVAEYLRDLNVDRIRERLEKLARVAADDLVGKDGAQAFG